MQQKDTQLPMYHPNTHTHTTQNPSLSDEYKMTFQFIVYWLRGPTSLHTDELPFCKRKVQR